MREASTPAICLERPVGQIRPAQLADTDVEEEVAHVEGKAGAAKVMNDERREDNQDDCDEEPEKPDQEARHTITSQDCHGLELPAKTESMQGTDQLMAPSGRRLR